MEIPQGYTQIGSFDNLIENDEVYVIDNRENSKYKQYNGKVDKISKYATDTMCMIINTDIHFTDLSSRRDKKIPPTVIVYYKNKDGPLLEMTQDIVLRIYKKEQVGGRSNRRSRRKKRTRKYKTTRRTARK